MSVSCEQPGAAPCLDDGCSGRAGHPTGDYLGSDPHHSMIFWGGLFVEMLPLGEGTAPKEGDEGTAPPLLRIKPVLAELQSPHLGVISPSASSTLALPDAPYLLSPSPETLTGGRASSTHHLLSALWSFDSQSQRDFWQGERAEGRWQGRRQRPRSSLRPILQVAPIPVYSPTLSITLGLLLLSESADSDFLMGECYRRLINEQCVIKGGELQRLLKRRFKGHNASGACHGISGGHGRNL